MRILSQAIKDVLAQDYAETRDVVIITIPEQQGATVYPETILYLGNGEGIYLDGHAYDNRLRAISAIKFSLGKAPDNADIAIENISRDLGFPLTDFQRALDGSKVEIKRAFKTGDLTWESNSMFTGYVTDTKVSQDKIELSITSDMSQRGTSVAGRPLTQRCILKFNVNGSGVGPICGWLSTQPGNPLSCDKGLETVNGCQSHGNQHRFGGVPPFTDLEMGNGYDTGGGGGWGEGSGGGWCVGENSLVLSSNMGKKVWRPVSELSSGDFVVSIDERGRFVPARIVRVQSATAKGLISLISKRGYKLTCSVEHGVMQNYNITDPVAAGSLKLNDSILVYDFKTHTHFKDTVEEIIKEDDALVYRVSLESPNHLYMATETEEGAIVSHNTKPIWTTQGSGGYPEGWYNNF